MKTTTANRGSILLISVSTFILTAALISTLFMRSLSENNNAIVLGETSNAFNYAEAGIADAVAVLRKSSFQWDDELAGLDGNPGTSDDGYLSFGSLVAMPEGTYSVRVFDNQDESSGPDDPTSDKDGVIIVRSIGQANRANNRIEVYLKSIVDLAIAAEVNITMAESAAMGSIHANGDLVILATSDIVGDAEATASGDFIFGPGETLNITQGDLIGGDERIFLPWPDAVALEAAVTRWNPPGHGSTVMLQDRDVAGYRLGTDITADSITTTGVSTLVVFDAKNLSFSDAIGTLDSNGNCSSQVPVNLIAVGGGGISFGERSCINGLIWAEGDINIEERSKIRGAVISANGNVNVGESANIIFDRDVIDETLLDGFWGLRVLSWREY